MASRHYIIFLLGAITKYFPDVKHKVKLRPTKKRGSHQHEQAVEIEDGTRGESWGYVGNELDSAVCEVCCQALLDRQISSQNCSKDIMTQMIHSTHTLGKARSTPFELDTEKTHS